MRAVKRPNFNEKRSKAVLFDGKRFYFVDVEIGNYVNSECDYPNNRICIRENSPDSEAEFYHEIHHLYRPLLEPIWTPTLPTLADKELNSLNDECILAKIYAKEDVRKDIINTLIQMINSEQDGKSISTAKIIQMFLKPIVSLGRFDNIFEDIKIHDHLIKRHRINEERLKAIEKKVEVVYRGIRLAYDRLKAFYDWMQLLEELTPIIEPLVRKGVYPYGYVFYPIFDGIICKATNWKFTEYYDRCIRTLKDAKERFVSQLHGVFKIATLRRIDLELSRVTLMREVLEKPEVCYDLAYVLALNGLPKDEIEYLLDVKIPKGFRDPLTIVKNGEIVTWYKTYKINGIKTNNNVARNESCRLSVLQRLVRFRTLKNLHEVNE